MKKRTKLALAIASVSVAFASIGFIGVSPCPVKAEGESSSLLISSSSPSSSDISSSPESTSEFTIEGKTIEQWKDTFLKYQILGVSVSTIVTLLIYWILHYASKGDIKKALGVLNDAKNITNTSLDEVKKIKENYDITNENYLKAIDALSQTNTFINGMIEQINVVKDENKTLQEQNDSLKQILLTMAKNTPELVKNGTYKKIVEIVGGETDGEKQ